MPEPDADPRAEIPAVLARLAHCADDGDLDAYLGLLTADAIWEMPANPAAGAPADRRQGPEAIAAGVRARLLARLQGPGTHTRHVVTTISVGPGDGPGTARSRSYWMFIADTADTPRLVSVGAYDDEFRLVDGRWLLAHRSITVG